jgi:anti-sigma factor RsiW
MSRPISEDDLHAFIDGALAADRHAEVATYLKHNPDIAARFEHFADQRSSLRAALAPIAAEPVPPRINPVHLAQNRRRLRGMPWCEALAASLLLMAGGTGGWLLRGPAAPDSDRTGINALAQEAAYSYASLTDCGGDAASQVTRTTALPDLVSAGFRFRGGQMVPTQNGPANFLLYDDPQGRCIALFIRPMITKDQDAKMAEHYHGPAVGFSWADSGMGYSLVGKGDARHLHRVADEVRRQFQQKA